MGLFNRMKDPVDGAARIVSCSGPPDGATSGTCKMYLVVEAPGVAAFSAEIRKICKVARWPSPGMVLPCQVDRAKPDNFDVDVKSIPDWRDQARQQAEMYAQMANQPQGHPGAGHPGMGQMGQGMGIPGMVINQGATVHVQGAATPEQAAQAIRQAEMALGMDLDGDGVVGGTGPGAGAAAMAGTPFAPPPAGSGGGDVVSQLERLAALHRSGALTDQEFAAQKARLLGG
ncbi:MAG: SHOCT domain-containing protein [Ilumatobacter sp.]|nr:SHOCT domain-containing protein [Ilumatobacter sp.]